jgi:hypothetical protein
VSWEFLLVIGVIVLAFALRTFNHPSLFRLGSLTLVVASFLAGWLLGGSLTMGVVLAAVWLLLPWIEILTRLRNLRIPAERNLEPRQAPNRDDFPSLSELTSEIEACGFTQSEDVGWHDEESRQFYRLFSDERRTSHACICLAEQSDISFFYLSITSRETSGRVFMTWNYPFPYGLKFSPALELNRCAGNRPFQELLASHMRFLRSQGIADGRLAPLDAPALIEAMQKDLRNQIRHNLDIGIIRKDGENLIRYTARGLFFLWCQFLRDLVRIF